LHLLIDETHELPLTGFKVKHKDKSITENTTGTLNNSANPTGGIYWEYTYIVETNEYEIAIYVPGGIGDEKINGEDIWKHDRLILEVRATIDYVSGTPNEPEQMMEITRSCIFTIHGVACGEDGVVYQIQPTYNNIKINVVCTHTSPIFCKPFNPSKDDQGYFVEQWSKYDDTLKEDNWVERCALKIMYQDLVNNGHPITHWIYGHFHNHFELEYEGRKFIGLDMCYQNKRRVDVEDPSTYEVVETYYKVLDDWYWLSEKGKIGNRA